MWLVEEQGSRFDFPVRTREIQTVFQVWVRVRVRVRIIAVIGVCGGWCYIGICLEQLEFALQYVR